MTTAALYLRVSLDATGERLAVDRQREDCLKIAVARGWAVVGEYVDNSISASDARKERPGYDQLVRDYEAGRYDALLCWDLDRLTRQPRQMEDWIDRAEKRGLWLVTANGEADLATNDGRLFARIKMAVARSEIEQKGRRRKAAQKQRAEKGLPAKGVRPTGYTVAGEVMPGEAATVQRIFNEFSAGNSLKGIAAGLQADGVPTRRGGRWSSGSVSTILRNARYAGRSIYKGKDVGEGQWAALVSEARFDAAQARLNDPRRRTRQDTARKHLGSGLYFCECGLRVRASSGIGQGLHRYTCRHNCFYRSGAPIDDYVVRVIRARLARPDLVALIVRRADAGEVATLNATRKDLRDRIKGFEADYDNSLIDGRRYRAAVQKAEAQLADVQRRHNALIASEAPGSVLGAEDPVAAFDAAPLAIRQRVIDALAVFTLHPGVHGSRTFRPESVTVEWRGGDG